MRINPLEMLKYAVLNPICTHAQLISWGKDTDKKLVRAGQRAIGSGTAPIIKTNGNHIAN